MHLKQSPTLSTQLFNQLILVACLLCSLHILKNLTYGEEQRTKLLDEQPRAEFKELAEYEARVKASLTSEPPVLNLLKLDEQSKLALSAAYKNLDFLKAVKDPASHKPYRNEIFSVRPVKPGDLPAGNSSCTTPTVCRAVEMYNFTRHLTTYAVVNTDSKQVIQIRAINNLQPEIPEHLEALAIQIAKNTPEVQAQLGDSANKIAPVMAGTKTSLNRTRCERSQHICVSPTFVLDGKALWTIVDLEEGRVVGTAYSKWDSTAPFIYTEQALRDQHILEELCQKSITHEQDGWKFAYQLTSSDGIEVRDATFNGIPRYTSAKNVDWHVSYSDKEGFGYSDAIGCPLFSAAAVVPAKLPKFKELKKGDEVVGFELHQDFISKQWPLPCNYYYEQRFQFFKDGRFRVAVASVGRGCGVPGIYRPVIRIEFPFTKETFASWDANGWKTWNHEGWVEQSKSTKYSAEGYQFRIENDQQQGFLIAPGQGQFEDKGRGDNAFTYIVRNHSDREEGQLDLPTIGPCCNNDFHQGPDKFIEPTPEALGTGPFVMWYVPQLTNDGAPGSEYCWGTTELVDGKVEKREFPCIAGPLFVPFDKKSKTKK